MSLMNVGMKVIFAEFQKSFKMLIGFRNLASMSIVNVSEINVYEQ